MTGRKVASLTGSLLARKGAARPTEPSAEEPAAAASSPVPPTAPQSSSHARGAVRPDVRAYAWPTQGPPPGDDDLAMPAPPAAAKPRAPEPASRWLTVRRFAMFGLAAAIAATVAGLYLSDAPPEPVAPAQTAATAPAVGAAAPPDRAADIRDGVAEAARTVEAVSPAAGGAPSPPIPPMLLLPPLETAAPEPPPEPPTPVTAASLVPPPIDRPAARAEARPEPPSPDAERAQPKPPAAPPSTRTAAAATGPFAVQIASVASKTRAQAESARLASRLAPMLDGRKPAVEEAAVAGRGTVFRIRVAGYPDRAAAERACTRIKGSGLDCLVVRR